MYLILLHTFYLTFQRLELSTAASHFSHLMLHTLQVLHVRSVSSWAPVCIGPYAQANVVHDSVIFVAGICSKRII
jgi:hypothetical protein